MAPCYRFFSLGILYRYLTNVSLYCTFYTYARKRLRVLCAPNHTSLDWLDNKHYLQRILGPMDRANMPFPAGWWCGSLIDCRTHMVARFVFVRCHTNTLVWLRMPVSLNCFQSSSHTLRRMRSFREFENEGFVYLEVY